MLAYWLLFAFFAAGALLRREAFSTRRVTPTLLLGSLLIWLAIGLRYKVGADWRAYEFLFSYAGVSDFGHALKIGDPAYQLVNWCIRQLGFEIWVVNLFCGLVFTWGLYRFARAQSDPWLAFVVAIPYLVIVVAMGYTRQATAIGILMAGLASLQRGASIPRFALYVAVAATFHKTAVVVLPLVIFAGRRNKFLNLVAGIAGFILIYDLFLAGSVDDLLRTYIQAEYSSQGAAIRVAMNLVPAVIFILFRNSLDFDPAEASMWWYFSLACLLMAVLLFALPSSTVVDRLALYLIPLQLAVISRIPIQFKSIQLGRMLVVAYSGVILFVWLNFATHAHYWIPYRLYPRLVE